MLLYAGYYYYLLSKYLLCGTGRLMELDLGLQIRFFFLIYRENITPRYQKSNLIGLFCRNWDLAGFLFRIPRFQLFFFELYATRWSGVWGKRLLKKCLPTLKSGDINAVCLGADMDRKILVLSR